MAVPCRVPELEEQLTGFRFSFSSNIYMKCYTFPSKRCFHRIPQVLRSYIFMKETLNTVERPRSPGKSQRPDGASVTPRHPSSLPRVHSARPLQPPPRRHRHGAPTPGPGAEHISSVMTSFSSLRVPPRVLPPRPPQLRPVLGPPFLPAPSSAEGCGGFGGLPGLMVASCSPRSPRSLSLLPGCLLRPACARKRAVGLGNDRRFSSSFSALCV